MAGSFRTVPTSPPAAGTASAGPRWLAPERFLYRHGRFAGALAGFIGLLVGVNILRSYGPAGTGVLLGPVVALLLILLGRRYGLSWSDLGLPRRTWARGATIAVAAVAAVAIVYAVAAALPLTRSAFQDSRYQLPLGQALLTAFVLIPLGTVLLEEIAFRGVLQGMVARHHGAVWGLVTSSVLFGVWHVLPSLGLNRVNPAVGSIVGSGPSGRVVAVLGAVGFTALAGLLLGELRRRSGSLIASSGLHLAVNGLGVVVASVVGVSGHP